VILPEHDFNVLSAVREMHSGDPMVLEVDPLCLQRLLKDEAYLPYRPALTDIGAALEALTLERGTREVG
jgi:hypothetical protein